MLSVSLHSVVMLSVIMLCIILLWAVLLCVVMLSIIMMVFVIQSVIMFSIIVMVYVMLSVSMLSAVMLNVLASSFPPPSPLIYNQVYDFVKFFSTKLRLSDFDFKTFEFHSTKSNLKFEEPKYSHSLTWGQCFKTF